MTDNDSRRSSRKRKVPESRAILDKIKKHRKSGEKIDYEGEQVKEIFEYVDEKEYADIIRKRQQDEWIEDDGRSNLCAARDAVLYLSDGRYTEHGRELFDEEADQSKRRKQKKVSINTHIIAKYTILLLVAVTATQADQHQEHVVIKETQESGGDIVDRS